MKGRMKRIIAFALAVVLLGTAVSCTDKKQEEKDIKISSTYNTLKVMQEKGFAFDDLGQRLDVFMARGETEGGQIIITPEKKISDIVVHTTDLALSTDPEVKFSKENIKVYFQKYIEISTKTAKNENERYPLGFVPDMLLLQELAVASGENCIEAGNNQGITVEFTSTAETTAGVYTGSFDLEADGAHYELPVSLKVYDITLDAAKGYLCIIGSAQNTMTGEFNTTDQSYRNYYETCLTEYRFSLAYLPMYNDSVKMAEEAVRYWDYSAFSSYCIPISTALKNINGSNKTVIDRGDLYSYLYELAVHSTKDRCLFDKAYIYPTFVDEATASRYDEVRMARQDTIEVVEKLFDDLTAKSFFDGWSEEEISYFEKSLKSMPIVQTSDSDGATVLGSSVQTYCSRLDGIDTPAKREIFRQVEEENKETNGTTWFYTCMEPAYPYPSHHIDDMLLSSRVMRWMQKDYDWDGYLFWQIFSYSMWTGSSTLLIDPYEDPVRFPNINGDGYWAYPGKKYGVDTFLPSVRLTAFRDGQEDYDLLCFFEELLNEKVDYYGIDDVSSHQYLDSLYDSLYEEANLCYEDDATFYEMRKKLFELIELHSSAAKFLSDTVIEGQAATTSIYLADGYGLEVNGSTVDWDGACGNGYKYTVVSDISREMSLDVAVTKGSTDVEEHHLYIAGKTVSADFSGDADILGYTPGSSVAYSDGKAEITLAAFGESQSELRKNVRYLWLTEGIDGLDLSKIQYIEFDLTNKGTTDVTVDFCFGKESSTGYKLLSYTIKAGETKHLKFDDMATYITHYSKLSSAEFGFSMKNAHSETVIEDEKKKDVYMKDPDGLFVVTNMYYSYCQGEDQ